MKYSIEHISRIIGGDFLQFHQNDIVENILLDSRRLIFPETSLFFALRGPRREGNIFVEELYGQGVRNFVVDKDAGFSQLKNANIILVRDSLHALQSLVAFHRNQFDFPVIGITGSNGKTIVKEWLNQLLEDHYSIVRSPKSYNSQTGVPLSVWQMDQRHGLGIFEAGISKPGEMEKLAPVIAPTIGVFVNIGDAHNEGFESMEQKIHEKLKLFDTASVVIFPADDEILSAAISQWKERMQRNTGRPVDIFGWGQGTDAVLRVKKITRKEGSTLLELLYRQQEFLVAISFTDAASVQNILTCIGVLLYLRMEPSAIVASLQRLLPVDMRLELKNGINNCSVINDSYSADLSSLAIALDFLSQQQQHNRHTVILSDILQSGLEAHELYHRVAKMLQKKKIHRLIGIGEKITANRAQFDHFPGELIFFDNTESFRRQFHHLHFRDEVILIKGARVFEFEAIDELLSLQVHQTVMEISLDAMAHNLRQYRQALHPGTRVMAMVKAFSYGSGSYEIANFLQFHKIDYLGVAYADEGLELRKAGIHTPIMILNPEDSSWETIFQHHLEPVIYSFRLLQSLESYAKKEGVQHLPVHIEIETGMNRLGFSVSDVPELSKRLTNKVFRVQSVFSHLAASEEPDMDHFTYRQGDDFTRAANQIQEIIGYGFLRHIANSAAIVRHPWSQMDMVRLGIGLYGVDSAESRVLQLQEVATLRSTIAQIRELDEDQTVGYNRKGVINRRTTMATIRIGYADGYPRSLGNGQGKIWVKGIPAPTLGNICMDMTMVDITGIPGVGEGDEVIIFGKELSVVQLANWAGTIPYEILSGVSHRVKRVYFEE